MDVYSQVSRGSEVAAWGRFAVLMGLFAMVFAAAAIPYSRRFQLGFGAAAGIYLCFLLLLTFALLPGVQAGRRLLAGRQCRWRELPLFLVFCIPYFLYAWGSGDLRMTALLRVAGVAVVPALLYLAFPVRDLERFGWTDLRVGCFLIAVVLWGGLRHIWSVPVNLDFMGRLLLIAVAAATWTFVRRVPDLHYRLQFNRRVLQAASLNFLYFAVIAIPTGLLIGFTGWQPRWHGAASFALDFLEIFLFIALLEEMFFRGFLQSLLSRTLGSALKAQLVASLVFGLFHILHAPFPNWRYVALASVAGWFYGEAYRRGGSLLASALTHAMVDTVWRTWLSRT